MCEISHVISEALIDGTGADIDAEPGAAERHYELSLGAKSEEVRGSWQCTDEHQLVLAEIAVVQCLRASISASTEHLGLVVSMLYFSDAALA